MTVSSNRKNRKKHAKSATQGIVKDHTEGVCRDLLFLGLPYSAWLACDDIRNFIPGFQGSFFIDFKPENISFYTINFSQKRNLGTDTRLVLTGYYPSDVQFSSQITLIRNYELL